MEKKINRIQQSQCDIDLKTYECNRTEHFLGWDRIIWWNWMWSYGEYSKTFNCKIMIFTSRRSKDGCIPGDHKRRLQKIIKLRWISNYFEVFIMKVNNFRYGEHNILFAKIIFSKKNFWPFLFVRKIMLTSLIQFIHCNRLRGYYNTSYEKKDS